MTVFNLKAYQLKRSRPMSVPNKEVEGEFLAAISHPFSLVYRSRSYQTESDALEAATSRYTNLNYYYNGGAK